MPKTDPKPLDVTEIPRAATPLKVDEVSTDVVPVDTVANLPAAPIDEVHSTVATLGAKLAYARVLALSPLIPDGLKKWDRSGVLDVETTVANVFLVMEYGQLLRLAPVIALTEITVVKGKPGMSAKLMRARVREAGHDLKILTPMADRRRECTVHIVLADGRSSEPFTFTVEDAAAMDLCQLVDGKVRHRAKSGAILNWESMTDTMLLERATSKAVRGTCPEILMGVAYTTEEIEAMVVDLPEPPPLVDLVYPDDYEDDTPMPTVTYAKNTVKLLVGGNAELAGEIWRAAYPTDPASSDGWTLGLMRAIVAAAHQSEPAGRELFHRLKARAEIVSQGSAATVAMLKAEEGAPGPADQAPIRMTGAVVDGVVYGEVPADLAAEAQRAHDEETEGMPHANRGQAPPAVKPPTSDEEWETLKGRMGELTDGQRDAVKQWCDVQKIKLTRGGLTPKGWQQVIAEIHKLKRRGSGNAGRQTSATEAPPRPPKAAPKPPAEPPEVVARRARRTALAERLEALPASVLTAAADLIQEANEGFGPPREQIEALPATDEWDTWLTELVVEAERAADSLAEAIAAGSDEATPDPGITTGSPTVGY